MMKVQFITSREDRFAAIELQLHLLKKGHIVSLRMTDRFARAGYIKSISSAMAKINPFLNKGYSANKAIEMAMAMESV